MGRGGTPFSGGGGGGMGMGAPPSAQRIGEGVTEAVGGQTQSHFGDGRGCAPPRFTAVTDISLH